MVFVAAGVLLASGLFGERDLLIDATGSVFMGIAEFSLALLIFSDASKLSLREVEGDHRPVAKMLLLAFPLTFFAGFGVAMLLFPHYGWQAALLVSLLLCPTDTTLAGTAVTDEKVPSRVRRILSRSGFRAPTIAYLGWFGLRGLATVIFAIVALQEIGADPITDHLIQVATIAAVASIFLHGLTAGPLSRAYPRWSAQLPPEAPVLAQAPHHQPLRRAVVTGEHKVRPAEH